MPLALFTFGVGSILQSAFRFGVVPQDESRNMALIFGGVFFPSMFLAAVFAFLSRETLGATALVLISFSWLATSFVTYTSAPTPRARRSASRTSSSPSSCCSLARSAYSASPCSRR